MLRLNTLNAGSVATVKTFLEKIGTYDTIRILIASHQEAEEGILEQVFQLLKQAQEKKQCLINVRAEKLTKPWAIELFIRLRKSGATTLVGSKTVIEIPTQCFGWLKENTNLTLEEIPRLTPTLVHRKNIARLVG